SHRGPRDTSGRAASSAPLSHRVSTERPEPAPARPRRQDFSPGGLSRTGRAGRATLRAWPAIRQGIGGAMSAWIRPPRGLLKGGSALPAFVQVGVTARAALRLVSAIAKAASPCPGGGSSSIPSLLPFLQGL